jgi:Domain of unknown function (DU1801)
MSDSKTTATAVSVGDFLSAVTPDQRRDEGRALDAIFREVTGFRPRMWGPSIIGYGRYAYRYGSGRSGESCATGFSPRDKAISVYGVTGFTGNEELLARLGRHKLGKGCLYLTRLADADQAVLRELIRCGLDDLRTRWPVFPD